MREWEKDEKEGMENGSMEDESMKDDMGVAFVYEKWTLTSGELHSIPTVRCLFSVVCLLIARTRCNAVHEPESTYEYEYGMLDNRPTVCTTIPYIVYANTRNIKHPR